MTGLVRINVRELLRFFDEKSLPGKGHATGIVAMIGEDLNTACFQHYLESQGATVEVLPDTVGLGGTKGPKLDRWILVTWNDESRTLFQTEIKKQLCFCHWRPGIAP